MAIEDMIRRIMDEARAENQKILTEAKQQAGRIRTTSSKETDKEISEMERKLLKEIEQTRNIYISDGKRKARQALLSSKEELIWDAICAIRDRIKMLEGDELGSYLYPMLARTLEIIGEDARIYAVRKVDHDVLSRKVKVLGLIEEFHDTEEALGRYRGNDLLGGFVATSNNGDRIVDMSFHGLLERNEERIRETIAEKLFRDL